MVVYGHSDDDSREAAEVLSRAGVGTVRGLRGGMQGWVASGLPLATTGQQVSMRVGEQP